MADDLTPKITSIRNVTNIDLAGNAQRKIRVEYTVGPYDAPPIILDADKFSAEEVKRRIGEYWAELGKLGPVL